MDIFGAVDFLRRRRQIFPLGVQAAILAVRAGANQGRGEPPALETHGAASVGQHLIPGDVVVGAFVAVDGSHKGGVKNVLIVKIVGNVVSKKMNT